MWKWETREGVKGGWRGTRQRRICGGGIKPRREDEAVQSTRQVRRGERTRKRNDVRRKSDTCGVWEGRGAGRDFLKLFKLNRLLERWREDAGGKGE